MNALDRDDFITKLINSKLSLMSEEDLRTFYVENMYDWYCTWDDEELADLGVGVNND